MMYQTAQAGRKLTSEALVGILILVKSGEVRILFVWTPSVYRGAQMQDFEQVTGTNVTESISEI